MSPRASDRLWVVADQLPYPPRNGVSLPLVNYIAQLRGSHDLRLVLLSDAGRPADAAELAANQAHFGPLAELSLRRRGGLARMAAEVSGSDLFTQGWQAADVQPLARWLQADSAWQQAAVLVSPISALSKWRAVRRALPALQPRVTVAAVHDCTAAEYRWRHRSPHPGLLGPARAWSHWLRAPLVARAEATLLTEADHVLVQTPADHEALRRLVGEATAARVTVAPNGVRADLFALPPLAAEAAPNVLFVAELSGEYAATTAWLCQEVWPRVRAKVPAARLQVVGRGAAPALQALMVATPGVQSLPFAPDLAPLYADSRVVFSPLWKGFGLINKTLEAMAAARPVVGGRAAFNGIDGFVDGQHGVGLERADAAAMAHATVALLAADAVAGRRARHIGLAARELVASRFDWARTGERLRDALARPATLRHSAQAAAASMVAS